MIRKPYPRHGKCHRGDLTAHTLWNNKYQIEKSIKNFSVLDIGILLCRDKNDALVELTLPENANIYAAQYELYLPDKKLLQKKLEQWLSEEGFTEI